MKSLDPTIHHLTYLVPILVLIFTHLRLIFVPLGSGTCAAGWTLHGTQCYKLIQVNRKPPLELSLYFMYTLNLIPKTFHRARRPPTLQLRQLVPSMAPGGSWQRPPLLRFRFFSKCLSHPLFQGVLDTLNAAGTPADFWIGLDDQ